MENNTSNSEEQLMQDAVMNADSGNFFDDLDKNVNSAVVDEGIQSDSAVSEQVTSEPSVQNSKSSVDVDWDSESNPYKKRYSDSSREAQKLANANKENEQYGALINVMKKDPKLIETVQSYLEKGGNVSVKEAQNLPEDFVFDPDEAFTNPQSPSAQVFDKVVENIVDRKVNQSENNMKNAISQTEAARTKRAEARKWMKENKMSEQDFASMMDKADKHKITYDDINLILNRDRVQQNVANSTKKDMVEQMKNARSVPQTASAMGGADTGEIAVEDQIFNAMKGLDSSDNLFGKE